MKTRTIGIIVVFLIVIFGLQWLGIANYRFFEPKRQDAQREVFEYSQSYVEAKRQEIIKHRLEYMRSDDEQTKSAILFTVRQSTSNFDESVLNSEELIEFVELAKYGE